MKKSYLVFLFAVFSVLAVALFCCKANKNTDYNLDFENIDAQTKLPVGWGLGNVVNSDIPTDSSLSAYKIDATIKQNGRYSLLIDWT